MAGGWWSEREMWSKIKKKCEISSDNYCYWNLSTMCNKPADTKFDDIKRRARTYFRFYSPFLRAAFRHRPSHINSFPSIAGRQHRRLRSNPTLLFNVDFLTASVCADCTYVVGTRLKVRFEGVTGNYVAARAFLYLQTALQSASYWHCLCTETKRLQRYLCVAYIKSGFNRRK